MCIFFFNNFDDSAGKRNCIGARYAWATLKIALSYILRRFKLTTDLEMEDILIKPELLLKISNKKNEKKPIRLERREWHTKNPTENRII